MEINMEVLCIAFRLTKLNAFEKQLFMMKSYN